MAKKIRRRNPEIVRVEVEDGSAVGLRKMQGPERQRLLKAAPEMFAFLGEYIRALSDPEVAQVRMEFPAEETDALIAFLVHHTTGWYGMVDDDGNSISWDRLSDAEQVLAYRECEAVTLIHIYLRHLGADLKARVPRGQGARGRGGA